MERFSDDSIQYKESTDMILADLKFLGYDISKEHLKDILQNRFSISSAVRIELGRKLDREIKTKEIETDYYPKPINNYPVKWYNSIKDHVRQQRIK